MKLQEGQKRVCETCFGKEEALYFQVEGNVHWVKHYLCNGRYEIQGLLAIGGFGCVFVANDRWNYDNQVVIKTPFYMGDYCRPYITRSQEIFEKQIRSLNRLYEQERKHLCGFSNAGFDSIVNLNDYFTDFSLDLATPFRDAAGVEYYVSDELQKNAPYVVMKYIEGNTLREVISKQPLDVERTLSVARQILALLCYLHKNRKTQKGRPFYYLLCDLKAENIIVSDEQVTLIDFGAIKSYWMDQEGIDVPIFVTDGYAAPEVYSGSLELRDNQRIDNRFDIFTVGALMVHCLTGKHPQQFLVHHSPPKHDFDLSEYSHIPTSVNSIIQKSTSKNRENRYQSADEMLDEVRQMLRNLGQVV